MLCAVFSRHRYGLAAADNREGGGAAEDDSADDDDEEEGEEDDEDEDDDDEEVLDFGQHGNGEARPLDAAGRGVNHQDMSSSGAVLRPALDCGPRQLPRRVHCLATGGFSLHGSVIQPVATPPISAPEDWFS